MPYQDPEKRREYQRAYQRAWVQRRRDEWFQVNGPCVDCGSWDGLQLDHRDPNQKVDHRVWSWSESRREAELAKCQALCDDCHMAKSITERAKGENVGSSKLSNEQADEIRRLYATGSFTMAELGDTFGIHKTNVSKLIRGLAYRRGTASIGAGPDS